MKRYLSLGTMALAALCPTVATAQSSNADLATLTFSRGTLAPAFDPATTSGYTINVPYGPVDLNATAADPLALAIEVDVNGGGYVPIDGFCTCWPLTLNLGPNTVDVRVTAEDGTTQKVYSVAVNRLATDVDASYLVFTNGVVNAQAVQPDGKVLIGGVFFDEVNGSPVSGPLARLQPDGTLDTSFDVALSSSSPVTAVMAVAVQPDGRILVGGTFEDVGGEARNYVARLSPSGLVDPDFNPSPDNWVTGFAVQPDGKILITGVFEKVAGVDRLGVARLNVDGSLDTTFDAHADSAVNSIALLPDGDMILGGDFSFLGGTPRKFVARVNPDGSVDTSFDPGVGPDGPVFPVAVQPNGKVLIAGQFKNVAGTVRGGIARLHANGALDGDFDAAVTLNSTDFPTVAVLTLQANGKIVIGGEFDEVGGIPRSNFARLNADGTLAYEFDPEPSDIVTSIALQSDGQILIAGWFFAIDGDPSGGLARIFNEAASEDLIVDPSGARVEWQRGGSSAEAVQVSFELSIDAGANWLPLGFGQRISNTSDWQLDGLALPSDGILRARAHMGTGSFFGNGSLSLLESVEPFTGLPAPADVPEIEVSGNSVVIADGSATPSLADHTDFGNGDVADIGAVRTFTISNGGTALLAVGSVSVGGADAGDFRVVSQPLSPIAPGNSATFQVVFDATALGPRSATLSFANNDDDENPFDFAISGTGVACPAITLNGSLGNGIEGQAFAGVAVASGGTGPYTYAVTFGSAPTGLFLVQSGGGAGGFTGTPSAAGEYEFEITATDTGGSGACRGRETYTVLIGSDVQPGQLVISEFRTRGKDGQHDEYVEVTNTAGVPLTIVAADGTGGFGIVGSNVGACPTGATGLLALIPDGAVIPAGGSYLVANDTPTTGYSLANYGLDGGAIPDSLPGTWTDDLCDDSGIAVFSSATNWVVANDATNTRLDAVGFANSPSDFREGNDGLGTTLVPAAGIGANEEWAIVRRAPYPLGVIKDSGDNESDFLLVSTNALDAGVLGARSALGSPGPQNSYYGARSLPLQIELANPLVSANAAPNRFQSGNYFYFRRKITNTSAEQIVVLRFRIQDLTTRFGIGWANPGPQADWRGIETVDVEFTPGTTAKAMIVEDPSVPYAAGLGGGGYNASFAVDLGGCGCGGLNPGESVYVNLGFRQVKSGNYYFVVLPQPAY